MTSATQRTRAGCSDSMLSAIVNAWHPKDSHKARELTLQSLRHIQALSNLAYALAEERAVRLDADGFAPDLLDPWDECTIKELSADLLDITAKVVERHWHVEACRTVHAPEQLYQLEHLVTP